METDTNFEKRSHVLDVSANIVKTWREYINSLNITIINAFTQF